MPIHIHENHAKMTADIKFTAISVTFNFRLKTSASLNKVRGLLYIALNWFKPPIKVFDRTKAVTQHLLKK